MPPPTTSTSNVWAVSRSRSRTIIAAANRTGLLAPGRNDVVHPRVRDQLTQVLVQIARDERRDLRRRQVHAHHLALAGQRRRIRCLALLLRVRAGLVQVIDDL